MRDDTEFDQIEDEDQMIIAALQENLCLQNPVTATDISSENKKDDEMKLLMRYIQEGWPKTVPRIMDSFKSKGCIYNTDG